MFINDSLRFVPTRHRVQQVDAHKRKLQQARTRAQNVIYSGNKGSKSYFYPLIDPKPLPDCNRN